MNAALGALFAFSDVSAMPFSALFPRDMQYDYYAEGWLKAGGTMFPSGRSRATTGAVAQGD
jgi:hypothetical protein